MPGCSGVLVVTNSYAFFCIRGCGCIERPVFPAPSFQREPDQRAKLEQKRGARSRNAPQVGRDGRTCTTDLGGPASMNYEFRKLFSCYPNTVIPGHRESDEPGISRFRVRCGAYHRAALCADPLASHRNDGVWTEAANTPRCPTATARAVALPGH